MERKSIQEASEYCEVPYDMIISFLQREWINPENTINPEFDDEDMARIGLIWELMSEFGVNDEAMPIILNLLDQLYRMHLELRKYQSP